MAGKNRSLVEHGMDGNQGIATAISEKGVYIREKEVVLGDCAGPFEFLSDSMAVKVLSDGHIEALGVPAIKQEVWEEIK